MNTIESIPVANVPAGQRFRVLDTHVCGEYLGDVVYRASSNRRQVFIGDGAPAVLVIDTERCHSIPMASARRVVVID